MSRRSERKVRHTGDVVNFHAYVRKHGWAFEHEDGTVIVVPPASKTQPVGPLQYADSAFFKMLPKSEVFK